MISDRRVKPPFFAAPEVMNANQMASLEDTPCHFLPSGCSARISAAFADSRLSLTARWVHKLIEPTGAARTHMPHNASEAGGIISGTTSEPLGFCADPCFASGDGLLPKPVEAAGPPP